ncbi:MAG: peptidylprolyl isomerase [Bacteroidetes bacterium]|nr:peptidylprolyl isomerase [Bacteroidota bacterium]
MKLILGAVIFFLMSISVVAQKMTVAQMKAEIEKATNSPLYVKDVLKKKFKIDTVVVARTKSFNSLADSLAYKGQLKKVYGPYTGQGNKFLVQILAKAPNTFHRVSQIFIDTSIMRYKFADSLGNSIVAKLNSGADTFEHQAQIYSMGGEASTQGDLGWVAEGVLIPEIANQLSKKKKGQVFKVWSRNGLHIIKKTEDSKKDTGFALMMRVFL